MRLSIGIPTHHGRREALRAALESILSQLCEGVDPATAIARTVRVT